MTLKRRKHYSIGIDGGNSDGKGALVKGQRLVTMTLPSVSTSGNMKTLAQARIADGARTYDRLADVLEADEYVLSYQEPGEQKTSELYFGKLAMREYPYTASSGRGDPSRSWTGRLLKLCFVLAGTLIQDQEAELFLVTGLPTKTFAERTIKQVVDSLAGDHTFMLNGRKRRFIIEPEHIRVVQEGAAAAKALAKPIKGFQGTIDPGGYSTEFFVINEMHVVASMCGGIEVGVENIADFVENAYKDTYQIDQGLTIQERTDILRAWADPLHCSYPDILIDRVPVPLTRLKEWTEQGVHQVGGQINEILRQRWKHGEQGNVATTFKQVNLIGGGAWYLKKAIEEAIPGLHRPEKPELRNVMSYALLAHHLEEKAVVSL
jgi:hypothetical protein